MLTEAEIRTLPVDALNTAVAREVLRWESVSSREHAALGCTHRLPDGSYGTLLDWATEMADAHHLVLWMRENGWQTSVAWVPSRGYGFVSVARFSQSGQFVAGWSASFVRPGESCQREDAVITDTECQAICRVALLVARTLRE